MELQIATHKLNCRWLIHRDVEHVLKIEQESFADPWTEDEMRQCLRKRNGIGNVVEHKGEVAGYVFYELHKDKLVIVNLAIAESHRRHRLGTSLIIRLQDKLSQQKRSIIELTVRERNLPMLKLLQSRGFIATECLRDFYGDEDGIQMVYRLGWSVDEEC